MNGLKRFLGNKNTVTIIGVLAIIAILYFGYTYAVNKGTETITIPYAKVVINPRTKITADMIGYTKALKSTLQGSIVISSEKVIGKYTNINSTIAKGGLFYSDLIINFEELPDAALTEIPEGRVAFNLPVDIESTYGNSIFPGNYIDIYFKGLDSGNKIMVGKLLQNVKVLAVKDKNGDNVFENTEKTRTPSTIIFAVSEEIHLLLRKALYLSGKDTAVELIPVPTNEALKAEPGETSITSSTIVEYINSRSTYIPQTTTDETEETIAPTGELAE